MGAFVAIKLVRSIQERSGVRLDCRGSWWGTRLRGRVPLHKKLFLKLGERRWHQW